MICYKCKFNSNKEIKYCPNCGTLMEEHSIIARSIEKDSETIVLNELNISEGNQNEDVQFEDRRIFNEMTYKELEYQICGDKYKNYEQYLASYHPARYFNILITGIFIYIFYFQFKAGFDGITFKSLLDNAILIWFFAIIIQLLYIFILNFHENYIIIGYNQICNGEEICTFLSNAINIPQFSKWTYGYDEEYECEYVEYTFNEESTNVILIYSNPKDNMVKIRHLTSRSAYSRLARWFGLARSHLWFTSIAAYKIFMPAHKIIKPALFYFLNH